MPAPKGRVLGIDFGSRHIGVALSDELRIIAKGYETINWNSIDPEWALNRITEIVRDMNVIALVIGKPTRTDGDKSETELMAEEFGKELEKRTGLTPEWKDERFTTVLAARYMHDMNMNTRKQRKVIDQVATEIILQEYLDSKR